MEHAQAHTVCLRPLIRVCSHLLCPAGPAYIDLYLDPTPLSLPRPSCSSSTSLQLPQDVYESPLPRSPHGPVFCFSTLLFFVSCFFLSPHCHPLCTVAAALAHDIAVYGSARGGGRLALARQIVARGARVAECRAAGDRRRTRSVT